MIFISRRAGEDPLSTRGALALGGAFLILTLLLIKVGWCGCTLFAVNAWALIGSAVLLRGNNSFGVLAEEKEKKTLDCLRLTQLSASRIFWFKLAPEFRSLARQLVAFAPAVLLGAAVSPSGLTPGFGVLAIAALAGIMSIVLSLFVSSLASSTSRAVVQGWTLKACWLLLTPILDLVVAAVTVTTTRYPIFDAINPFAAAWPLVVPEAQLGLRQHLPLIFLILGSALTALMWWVACRRYDQGLTAAPSLTDRHVHQLYRRTPGWVPSWLGVRENPIFLRELASQLRSGAGKWPGYAVFLTLFLAPFLYSQSWNERRTAEYSMTRETRLQASHDTPIATEKTGPGATEAPHPYIRLHSFDGTELHLNGHANCGCLRMGLYQSFHVPLPASQVVKVEYRSPLQNFETSEVSHGPREVPLSSYEAASYGVASRPDGTASRSLSSETLDQIRMHSMNQGLLGCLVLLSLYLAVRCSGFLANAVTSECDRRSWTDLALTGIGPEQVLSGKLFGTLLMPLIQLAVAAPALLLFVVAGVLSPLGAVELVSYAALLAVAAGLIGFHASSASPTSHGAQGLALAHVLGWLVVTPVAGALFGRMLMIPLIGVGLLTLLRPNGPQRSLGWFGLAAAALISPLSLSPWTCLPFSLSCGVGGQCSLFSFFTYLAGMLTLVSISALCTFNALANLQQPGQEDTLRADRIA